MELGHFLNHASGRILDDCHCLGYRFDESIGFRPDVGESWIISTRPEYLDCMEGRLGWYTGLWRSEAKKAYVTAVSGRVLSNPKPTPGNPWATTELPGVLEGVWGFDDQNVYVWGRKGGDPLMYFFNGTDWSVMESPGFVVSMHGIAKDFVVAAGEKGMVAHWNGNRWTQFPAASKTVLSDIYVADEDEIYVCGVGTSVFEGSAKGWNGLVTHPQLTGCIAKWKGQLWVGVGGDLGLSVLEGDSLTSKKPNIIPNSFDARHSLVMTASVGLVGTPDGENYMGRMNDSFARGAANTGPPIWLE